ncbi:MAG: hypothetical protein IPH88_18710 [Bacteroidales bacterium]|nr:hypothetical protein [Bacteroidales bacterium]
MKFIVVSVFLMVVACKLSAQAPDLDYYSQLGFSAGYATGKATGAPSIGVIHNTFLGNYWFYEASACRLAFFNGKSQKSKIIMLDLMTIDMGFGYTSENFFIGISPCSINLTQSPNIGIAALSKCRIFENYVIETKVEPYLYGKPENYGLLNNNFYLGVHYWFSDFFSLGLRYNRYDYYRSYNIMASWNFL